MQFSRAPSRSGNDVHILSLVSIIFLLIIFFMVAGQLSAPDTLDITPPYSASERAALSAGLLVEVDTDGRIALDGTPITPAKLQSATQAYLAQYPNAPVRLKADGLTHASRVIAVMTVLREAGVEQVRLLTMESGG